MGSQQSASMESFDMEGEVTETPMSRTHQYRKVMKPMLERKRRARINNCLDELKELMVHALQTEGESITKLEKADVLELTVRHLRKLRRQEMLSLRPMTSEQDSYRAGYTACATEISRTLASDLSTDLSVTSRARVMSHLGHHLPVRVPVPQYPVKLGSPGRRWTSRTTVARPPLLPLCPARSQSGDP